jgi:bacterioferritin-associated ferredoxin
MYVCLCEGVTDRTIRKAIRRGATTLDELGRSCGAGTGCGGCWETLQELIAHPERPLDRHQERHRVSSGTHVAV